MRVAHMVSLHCDLAKFIDAEVFKNIVEMFDKI